ncbi:MAG: hypothetical protein KIG72_00960 [Bradymonadales bacterium]|nr:hypothetical protein [Bradymonadales bacterium]
MKKTLFLTTLALLAFGCDEGSDNNTTTVSKCGDGFIDVAAGEQCEIGGKVEATCQTYDSTKKWKEGGVPGCSTSCRLTVGTCEEGEAVCGDGLKTGGEACDKGDKTPIACIAFDYTKNWKAGGAAKCADDCESIEQGTCEEVETEAVCGDGIWSMPSEACDKAAKTPCLLFDPSKKWKDGGVAHCSDDCKTLSIGTCVEAEAECGDGYKNGAEVCDTVGDTSTKACSDLDSTKMWQDGSVATCKDDCSGYSMDTCVEELCGNGSKDEGEVCDPNDEGTAGEPGSATQTCQEFDSTKNWQAGGSATCKADCSGYEQNTCKEDTTTPEGGCTKAEDCTGDANNKLKQCIDSKCVECGENSHCEGNTKNKICDVTTHACVECTTDANCTNDTKNKCHQNKCVACKTNDDCSDGKVCNDKNACVADEPDANCKKLTGEGLYWCQLMDVVVKVSEETQQQEVKAYFHKGDDVTGTVTAKLVYDDIDDNSFKTMNAWAAIDATVTADAKYNIAKATIKKGNVGANGTYYTFKLSTDGTNWVYCERNHNNGEEASALACGNKPVTIKPDGQTQLNKNEVGVASVVASGSNTVAFFDFDTNMPAKFDKLSDTDCLTDSNGVKLCGTGTTNPMTKCTNAQNAPNNCLVGGDTGKGKALTVNGWTKAKPNDSDNAARIVLKNLQLGNAKNVLKVDISRTNATKSPTKIAVSYSTDGTNYTELGEISLLTDKTNWKNYEVNLDAAKNQNITLRMTPYHYESNSSALKFDNIVITKNNP